MQYTLHNNILEQVERALESHVKPKILMVDDRPENLVALERLLKHMNVELYKASSGNEALSLTLHHDFALALLDIQMPEMDGYELAELLRADESTSNLPFIFISAIYTDYINIFKGYEKGAFSYITKPFKPEILLNKVKLFVDKHQQEQALKRAHDALQKHADKLISTNQELKSFSYSVSHDLRAPLRIVDGYSKILLQDYSKAIGEEGQQVIMKIVKNVHKMTSLIEDLLEFSRVSRQVVKPEKIDLYQIFKEVYNELKEDQGKNIVFDLKKLSPVIADKILIRRLVTNLLSNAIKYSLREENPKIEVGEFENEEGVLVRYVKDNGVGFNEEYKEKLFEVFQRLHSHDEFQGSGVGLAIVQRVIHHHNGTIWGESKNNNGATFYFTLNMQNLQ